MEIPDVGELITTARARALCLEFGEPFAYLVRRIDAEPYAFTAWEFDGASMLPDGLAARVLHTSRTWSGSL